MELYYTLGLVAVEVAVAVLCYIKLRQPVNPARPRMVPYNVVLIVATLALLATLAHLISLLTGHQVQPRRKQGL